MLRSCHFKSDACCSRRKATLGASSVESAKDLVCLTVTVLDPHPFAVQPLSSQVLWVAQHHVSAEKRPHRARNSQS
ncbi:hypothetical protein WJX72_004274 [[Myrmecia] bisecta]|uniref:Uncharacterized protein n=1 Tax=[Myrmecia] bisecta TaxID=41462 RepID=A0AAW1R6D2_9CHLO